MSIEKEYLANESGVDYDDYTSDDNLDPRDCISSDVIKIVESEINEHKNTFYLSVMDIKSGHFDFPPEIVFEMLDILFQDIKQKILNELIDK